MAASVFNAQIAHQVPLVLMTDLDRKECNSLHEDITTMLESFIHPRHIAKWQHLLKIFSSVLYYGIPLLSLSQSTPGQDFCNLTMITENAKSGSGQTDSYSKISKTRCAMVAVLMALLPHVDGLWTAYATEIENLFATLTADDFDAVRRPSISPADQEVLIELSSQTAVDTHEGGQLSTLEQWLDRMRKRILGGLQHAAFSLKATYTEICMQLDSDNSRFAQLNGVKYIMSLLCDVHHLLFLIWGVYYNPALRLAGVKLMQKTANTRSISLRVLSWILGFRLTLLSANALLLFGKHFRNTRQQASEAPPKVEAAGDVPSEEGAIADSGFHVAGMEGRSCPLCMEVLQHPAVTPCGHVYCWSCIQGLCIRSALATRHRGFTSQMTQSFITKSKCPVCRTEFHAQSVRAVLGRIQPRALKTAPPVQNKAF